MSKQWHRDIPARVTEYLSAGGLFNPELMDHEAVRRILIDARDVIEIIARERRAQETSPILKCLKCGVVIAAGEYCSLHCMAGHL